MFEGVVRAADAGRVEEPENDPVDVGALFDDVARRAGDVRDHGPFFVEQAVEQGAFSDVRRSDDGYGDSLLDGVAERKRAAQGVDPLLDLPHGVAQLGAVGEFDLLFREVEFEFQLRGEVQQFFAQGVERCGITPAHLVGGERVRRPRGRGDDVGHGFGLREVEFARKIGPDGEFARLGHACAGGGQQAQRFGNDVLRTVARDFGGVLARIGTGRPEYRDQHVVERSPVGHDMAVMNRIAPGIGQRRASPENAVADRQRVAAAYADDGERPSCGGGRSCNGIVVADHLTFLRCGAVVRCGVCGRS